MILHIEQTHTLVLTLVFSHELNVKKIKRIKFNKKLKIKVLQLKSVSVELVLMRFILKMSSERIEMLLMFAVHDPM